MAEKTRDLNPLNLHQLTRKSTDNSRQQSPSLRLFSQLATCNFQFNLVEASVPQSPSSCNNTTANMFALRRSVAPIVQRSLTSSRQASTFAKMTLVGRLADTPELQATSTGREIVRYALATTSGRGETEKTSWFRVTSFTPEGAQRDFLTSLEKGYVIPTIRTPDGWMYTGYCWA